jgi:hypothetical protein
MRTSIKCEEMIAIDIVISAHYLFISTIVVRCIVIQNVWVPKEHLRGNTHASIFRPGIKCSNGLLSSV